jgi:hypothetical protein
MLTEIHLPFADGVYRFRLTLPMIHELQRKCGTGIGALFARVLKGRYSFEDGSFGMPTEAEYRVEDLIETLRCGLIGGGEGKVGEDTIRVTPPLAQQLVENYAYPAAPLKAAWDMAASILMACIEGYQDPQKKSAEPSEDPTEKDGSTSQPPWEISPSAGAVQ